MMTIATDDAIMQNPHCMQVLQTGRKYQCFDGLPLTRTLIEEDGAEYAPRDHEPKSVVFNYYRREFVEEVEFLTMMTEPDEPNVVMVVVGAAPGYDLLLLMQFFPSVRFILYDPLPIKIPRDHPSVLQIHQRLFTDDDARHIRSRFHDRGDSKTKVLLQCYTRISQHEFATNLSRIKTWHQIIRPYAGAYEVNLPYASDRSTRFIKGTLHYPIWNKPAGAECRLITDISTTQLASYDHRRYERCMMHFNTVRRTSLHRCGAHHYDDACYDCAAESAVVAAYCDKFRSRAAMRDVVGTINRHFRLHPSLPDWYPQKQSDDAEEVRRRKDFPKRDDRTNEADNRSFSPASSPQRHQAPSSIASSNRRAQL